MIHNECGGIPPAARPPCASHEIECILTACQNLHCTAYLENPDLPGAVQKVIFEVANDRIVPVFQ